MIFKHQIEGATGIEANLETRIFQSREQAVDRPR